MAQPQVPQNPFGGLLTSETLKAQRAQEAMAMAGEDPNQQLFASSIFQLTEALRGRGVGLTKEDIRARRNDQIVATASQRIAERAKDGQMDPDLAMASTMEEAFQEMLAAGDAESAAVLAPHIFAQRARAAEMEKLRAETDFIKSRPDIEASKAEAANLRAEVANMRVEFQNRLDEARANLANRTDPNLRRSSGGDGTKTTDTGFTKFRQQGGSVVGLLGSLGDLHKLYIERPGVASDPSTVISGIADSVKGAKELIAPENKAYNHQLVEDVRKSKSSQIEGLARSLNVDRGLLESTIIDTAYTLARARDPGGRISNADFDNALRLLGAARDPERAKAVIIDLGRRTKRDFDAQAAANPDFADEPVIAQVNEAYESLLGRAAGKKDKKPPKAPAGDDADIEAIINKYK